jgi:hypothetical protein
MPGHKYEGTIEEILVRVKLTSTLKVESVGMREDWTI